MKTTNLEFDSKTYVCRVVNSNESEELIIGSTDLLDALQSDYLEDMNEDFANKDAERLYDEVFFFVSKVRPQTARRRTRRGAETKQLRLV